MGWDKNAETAALKVAGRQVAEVRERRGWSQADLAERVNDLVGEGWHQTTVAKIEKGQRQIDVRALLFLAVALDVSPLHLIVPRDDDAVLTVTEKHEVSASEARAWIRGEQPLPDMDDRVFRTEVPDAEWQAAQQPSQREVEARKAWEEARHRARVQEKLIERLEQQRKPRMPEFGPDPSGEEQRLEQKIDAAYHQLAEAEVDQEEAAVDYRAAQRAREGE